MSRAFSNFEYRSESSDMSPEKSLLRFPAATAIRGRGVVKVLRVGRNVNDKENGHAGFKLSEASVSVFFFLSLFLFSSFL